MSESNGVIRVGRKGLKKFAFGEDGPAFEVDVVEAWQAWTTIDDSFRLQEGPDEGTVPLDRMGEYHLAAMEFGAQAAGNAADGPKSRAEALEFVRLLREEYEGLTAFFRPKSRPAPDSPASSGAELRFSEEES